MKAKQARKTQKAASATSNVASENVADLLANLAVLSGEVEANATRARIAIGSLAKVIALQHTQPDGDWQNPNSNPSHDNPNANSAVWAEVISEIQTLFQQSARTPAQCRQLLDSLPVLAKDKNYAGIAAAVSNYLKCLRGPNPIAPVPKPGTFF